MRLYLMLIVVIMSACACTDERAELLMNEVESVIDEQPDSALCWMRKIHGSSLRASQKARYALLLSKAQYKCYIKETNDSLINVATDYYLQHRDDYRLIQSLFYKAQIQFYAGKYLQSLHTATIAEQLDEFVEYPEFAARIYDLFADIYDITYDLMSDIKYRRLAAKYYDIAGMTVHNIYAKMDEARSECDVTNYIRSLEILDSIYPLCVELGDSVMIANCISSYFKPYLKLQKYSLLLEKVDLLNNYSEIYNFDVWDYKIMVLLNINKGDFAKANENLINAQNLVYSKADRLSYQSAKCYYLRAIGNYKDALILADSIIDYQNKEVLIALKQELNSIHRDYYHTQAQLEKKHRHIAHQQVITISILAIVIVFGLICYIKMKQKSHILKINEQIIAIGRFEKELYVAGSENKMLTKRLHELLASHFSTLNMICSNYYEEDQIDDRLRISVYNRLKAQLRVMASDASIANIGSVVNSCRDNIIEEFNQIYPDVSKNDHNIVVLLWAGFSVKSISFLTGINYNTIYSKRRRWKVKFMQLQSPYKEKFIEALT